MPELLAPPPAAAAAAMATIEVLLTGARGGVCFPAATPDGPDTGSAAPAPPEAQPQCPEEGECLLRQIASCQGRRRPPAVDGGPGIRPRRISVVPFPARRAREPPRLILSSRLSSSAASAQGRVETSHALRGRYKPTNAVFPKITTPRSYFQHPSSRTCGRGITNTSKCAGLSIMVSPSSGGQRERERERG